MPKVTHEVVKSSKVASRTLYLVDVLGIPVILVDGLFSKIFEC